MFRKVLGDVRHGYVESAGAEFVVYGDRQLTLDALRNSGRRRLPEVDLVQPENIELDEKYVQVNTIHGIGYFAAELVGD